MFSTGLLIIRVVVGLLFVGHGGQKLFGWFHGPGLKGMQGWLASLNLRSTRLLAGLAGVSEFLGGALLALGWLNPLGPLGIIASMIMAIALVHWPKLWATENGFEYPLVNIAVAAGLALTGPGAFSLDALMPRKLPMPELFLIGLVVVCAASFIIVSTRKHPVAKEQQSAA